MMEQEEKYTRVKMCVIIFLMLLCIARNDVMAAEYDAIIPALSQAIQGAMEQANITGLSVALVDDQEIVWAEGFGYADKANDVKATPETLYRIASVSKLFTATAIMQLVDQGKINLDEPLQTYLPEFSVKSRFPNADPITVRHLLTHHSGLPSDLTNGMQAQGDDLQALIERTFATLLDEIKDTYVTNPPNTVMSYSNLGYSVLGHVVERVTGQEFSAYVDEALLKPLGMPASSFEFTSAMSSSLSKEYQNGEQQEFIWSRDIPGVALHSTVLDLGQFMSMMFADGKAGSQHILQPQTVAEMWRAQNDDVPLDFDARWGLSWWLVDLGLDYAGKIAWHSGGEGMWNSLLVTLPEHKLGVVLLSNSAEAEAINFQIAPKILEQALEVKTGIIRPPVEPLELVVLSPDEVHAYEGLYTTESVGPISIRSEGTDLYAEAMGQAFKLLHHGEGRFSIEGVGGTELEIKTVNGRTALELYGLAVGGLGFGERIEPGPISEVWQNRLGRYEVVNGNPDFATFFTDIQMKYDRQVLVFEAMLPLLGMQLSLPMMPISDTEAVTLGLGRNCGETISVVEVDGEDHLFYSGYLMKKVETAQLLQATLEDAAASPDTNWPGAVLHVSSPELGSWSGATGVSNTETNTAMKPHDRFRAGSITKPFISVVMLQLVEEGRFSLDDPMTAVLPESISAKFANSDTISVRMLLNHTGGIADCFTSAVIAAIIANPQKVWNVDELLDVAAAQEPSFAPGEGQQYSNTDYLLLGLIIEQATGRSWREEMRERIFEKLHLENTSLPEPGDTSIPADHARGYQDLGEGVVDVSEVDPSMADAAGGHALVTNATDLAHFLNALMAGELFRHADTLNEMLTFVDWPDGNPLSGYVTGYGLGLMKSAYPGGIEMFGHSGDTAGFGAFTFYLPAQDITISGAVNTADPLSGFAHFIPRVLEILIPGFEFEAVSQQPAAAANIYQDPQDRFSMPLVGNWTQLETDGSYGHVAFAEPPLDMYVVTAETDDLAAGADAALRHVGIDPAELTLTDAGDKFGPWDLSYYSRGDDKGVTVTTQVRDETTYVLIITGNFVHTSTVPDHVVRTVGSFALSGEVILPATVEEFEAYVGDVVGDIPPGLSIAIALGKDVIYAKGFGMADGPIEMAAAADTVYQWGSVAKIATAVAIMQLSEQGLIDLDASVSDYLDYFPADYGITVRHLLSHSAGLPDPPNHTEINVRLDGQPLADADLIDRTHYEAFTAPSFEPGSTAAYGNVHYVTLGQIVAAVSGQSYVEYVREHVLVPLGMESTDFSYSSATMIAKAAAGAVPVAAREPIIAALDETRGLGDGADFFRETDERHAWMTRYNVLAAHGGLIGPATEVIRLAQMFLNEGELDGARVLSPESVALMQEMQLSTDGEPLGYALGWEIYDTGDHPHIAHPGGGSGLQALLRLYPNEGFAIVLMSNAGGYDYVGVADAAANVVFTMLGAGAQQKAPAPASAPPSAQTDNVYADPQGRFSMPLIGDWTPVETDGTYARYAYADMDLAMSIVTVESGNLEAAMDLGLRHIGLDPASLTETNRVPWDKWTVFYYSLGDGQGVTALVQTRDNTSYLIIATGDEALVASPPENVMKTIQGFSLAGEVSLPSTVEAFETYVKSFVGTRPPSLSIAIALKDDMLYAQGFGMADGPRGIAAAPDTVFRWGSVTKTVTATAIMQLREQGLIDLDAPVSDYLEYFPAQYPITARHMLTHSTGLPEPMDFLMKHLRLKGQPLPDFDAVDREYYADVSNLMFEPGSQSAYVNPDYVTLGQIVAAVSGQPYVEYVREHILNPLGMTNTDFTYSNDFMQANAATPAASVAEAEALVPLMDEARGLGDAADFFRETDENYAWMNHYIVGESAGGGLMGPATDMIRFGQMMLNQGELDGVRILSAESVALLQEVQMSTSGEPLEIGLAWHFGEDAEHPYIEHDGGGAGLQAKLRLYMQDGLAIAVMANGAGFDRNEFADAAANVVFSMLGAGAQQEAPAEAFTPPITDAEGNEIPGSIAAIETVTLGGIEQSITIRGVDTSKPVLLFLHGGPGVPSSPWVTWNNFQAELEAHFVVVHWDQRGAGKSFSEDLTPEDMHLENFVSDTLALTDILRQKFGQDKIFLWGHSWGSGLGFETLKVNAKPYHAYIASAVRPDWNSTQTMGYEWVLEQARQAKDSDAIQALESIQPFDPANREHINMRAHFLSLYRGGDFHTEGLEEAWLDYVLSGQSPEYPATYVEKTMAGMDFTRQTISLDILQSGYDLFRDFPESPIPVYFFAGRHDHETPGELAEDYYNVLEAPAKHFTWFENSAHNMMYDEPDNTNQELIRIANEVLNP